MSEREHQIYRDAIAIHVETQGKLRAERDEAREIAYTARRIADKHAAAIVELRAMVERLEVGHHELLFQWFTRNGWDFEDAEANAEKDEDIIAARALLERTKP